MTDFESAFNKVSKLVNDFKQNERKHESLSQQIDCEVHKLYTFTEVKTKNRERKG
jgi:hypothetical protein